MADGRLAGKPLHSDAWPRVRCHHNICYRLEPPPGPVMHPISVANLLPRATAAAIEEEVSAKENNECSWAGMTEDNNSIGLTEEIIPLLSCCYTIPPHT
ncbi:hypothetical protein CgunFtcFv8_003847 [Champsocephalus gunnari]|uniref:Uncharacterized protein n=1 Tax=Champsocephalus gunnari TaxID=52237 RepID=A0AAN8E5S5_CHAGU|nr:hypothetical protein CgunFtcFv8_003847 [Champsocephalus gunnari]